jgi:uncharacterized protein YceH (UPF0502 family)
MTQVATSPAPLFLVLILAAGAVFGFVALFRSGKREARLDEKLARIAADADLPAAIRTLAEKAKALELTKAAGDVSAKVDALEAQVKALIDKVK